VKITADPSIADAAVRSFVAREIGDVLLEVFDVLPGVWLPGHPDVVRKAQRKWSQLRTAADLGFTIPATLVSNDPERFLAFYRQHDGRVASKLAGATGFHAHLGTELNRYTEVIPSRDLVEYRSFALCPVACQRYISKQYELRITVVGDLVFCARIDSQRSNQSRHDWRQYDMASATLSLWQLPGDIAERCVALVKRLGLTYGAIDMIVTPDDEHVFLELNPSGQFWWLEQQLGLPISDAICDRLADIR
jgi:glutathione synthase/RimK-type ligase-like ATP-grasp enzyme